MDNLYDEDEARRKAEWDRKIARMRREKERALRNRYLFLHYGIPGLALIVILIVVIAIVSGIKGKKAKDKEEVVPVIEQIPVTETVIEEEPVKERDPDDLNPSEMSAVVDGPYKYSEADSMDFLSGDQMQSMNAILVDLESGQITGQVDYKARIVPASMTKVMTILVAAEHIDSIKDKATVTIEATDFAFKNDCSSVGFAVDETVTIEDLFYGTILSSGGDAAATLAMYVAGSQEAFVEMMNDKARDLGISGTTHFTNTVGIYNDDHYSTCYDMAIIMNAAIDNEFCRQVLGAKKYTTSSTTEHPEGIGISNWFLRRIEDKDCGGEVLGAKTGFVVQSGNCGVSYFKSNSGREYICCTANAHSAWRCIYDHVDIYKNHTI